MNALFKSAGCVLCECTEKNNACGCIALGPAMGRARQTESADGVSPHPVCPHQPAYLPADGFTRGTEEPDNPGPRRQTIEVLLEKKRFTGIEPDGLEDPLAVKKTAIGHAYAGLAPGE